MWRLITKEQWQRRCFVRVCLIRLCGLRTELGATFQKESHGHVWSNQEFVESHPRLSVNALHRAGGLIAGAETVWQWQNGLIGRVRATYGRIFLSVGNRSKPSTSIGWRS
jgi:hypothetical protein